MEIKTTVKKLNKRGGYAYIPKEHIGKQVTILIQSAKTIEKEYVNTNKRINTPEVPKMIVPFPQIKQPPDPKETLDEAELDFIEQYKRSPTLRRAYLVNLAIEQMSKEKVVFLIKTYCQ